MNGAPMVIVRWYTTEQAASALGITPRTLYAIINRGELKAHRIGRVIRITEDDLKAFFDGSVIEAGELDHLIATPGFDREEDTDGAPAA